MYKMYFLFIYIILFHSLAVYEVMLYLKYNQNLSNVYILFISFFFFSMKNRVHAASNKKYYSFSFNSLMKILHLFKPVLNVFQKKNCPIYYNHDNKQFMQKMQLWRERLHFGI